MILMSALHVFEECVIGSRSCSVSMELEALASTGEEVRVSQTTNGSGKHAPVPKGGLVNAILMMRILFHCFCRFMVDQERLRVDEPQDGNSACREVSAPSQRQSLAWRRWSPQVT